MSGDGWEHPRDEARHGTSPVRFRRCWGKPSAESVDELPLTDVQVERLERILAWAQSVEVKKKLWNNVDWLLQDVHFEEALGYRGVSSLTGVEKTARIARAAAVVDGAMSFFPGTEVEVLPPRPLPLRLPRQAGGAERKRKAVSIAGSIQTKKPKKAPPKAAVSVGGASGVSKANRAAGKRVEKGRKK